MKAGSPVKDILKATLAVAGLLSGMVLAGIPARAQSSPDDLEKLLKRVEQLEKRLAEQEARNAQLEARLAEMQGARTPSVEAQKQLSAAEADAQKAQADALRAQADALKAQRELEAKLAEAQKAQPAPPDRRPVVARSSVELYGYVKLDTSYDTGRVYPGNYALYVLPLPANGRNNSQTNITANQSRFGLNFKGPDTAAVKTTGRAEIDFYGGGAENKANPMMRHAFLQLEWPGGTGLLAGQTSDIISPLATPTVNYSVDWYGGNIGYRRPQLRFFQDFPLAEGTKLNLQVGLSRTAGRLLNGQNSGTDAGFPTTQARLALTFPGAAGRPATLGLSGHYGTELFIPPEAGPDQRYRSYSANLDLSLPLGKKVTLQAEAFAGRDLDAYLGGSSEPINFTKEIATESAGGWLALTFGPYDRWTFNLGAGLDDPRNGDLSAGSRSRNENVFGNAYFNITKAVQFQVEVAYWGTEYLARPGVHALRGQIAFQYNF